MFVRFVKYGKTVRRTDGTTVHAEVSLDLSTADYEEEAWAQAKRMVNRELAQEPLKATIGERLQAGVPVALSSCYCQYPAINTAGQCTMCGKKTSI